MNKQNLAGQQVPGILVLGRKIQEGPWNSANLAIQRSTNVSERPASENEVLNGWKAFF